MKSKVAFAALMGIITTGIISFTLISVNVGFKPGFGFIWLKSWAMAYILVIPVILLVGPFVQNIVNDIFAEKIPLDIEKHKE
jgi:low affinity Fe/Cu permease